MTNFDRTEKYHSGEMNPEERAAFERDLKTDSDLQSEAKYFQMAQSVIEADIESDLRNHLKDLQKKNVAGGGRIVPFNRILTAIAAGILALAAAWFVFFQASPEEQLFAQYFEKPADSVSADINLELTEAGFGGEEELLKKLKEGMTFYAQNEYEKAVPILKEVADSEGFYRAEDALFYLASAQLAGGKAGESVPNFSKLANSLTYSKREDALWLMALAFIKIGEREKAISVLEALPTDSKYSNSRIEILPELR